MSLVRYRPIIKNKEADMAIDVSGAWTSLTCYYTLHDKIVTLQAENERLRKDLDYVLDDWGCFKVGHSGGSGIDSVFKAWLAAKGVQS